jgi:hypothetical protein
VIDDMYRAAPPSPVVMENNNPEFAPANEAIPPPPVVVQHSNRAVDDDDAPASRQKNRFINEPTPSGDDKEQNYDVDALLNEEKAADALLNMLIGQYCRG